MMHIIEAREVRLLVSKPSVSIIVPYVPMGRAVQLVHPAGSLHVQHAEHFRKAEGVFGVGGRVGDEMVMVGKHRPGFQLPSKIPRYCKQSAM